MLNLNHYGGNMKRKQKKNRILFGVGINDANYVTETRLIIRDDKGKKIGSKRVWRCEIFERWANMLYRCYSKDSKLKNPTYSGVVTLCAEWLKFSNFKRWVVSQAYTGMELDKDILIQGNKEYSPVACAFVPSYINCMLTLHGNARGEWPIGVHKAGLSPRQVNISQNPFIATISIGGKKMTVGRRRTPSEAHQIWQLTKADAIDKSVQKWKFDSSSNHSFRSDVAEALWAKADLLREQARLGIETIEI